jgi:hypothetical protein
VTLTNAARFAAGYVMGAKAGRERYAQIIDAMARASQRLEEFSARRPPAARRPPSTRRPAVRQDEGSHRPDGGT